jgi:hypothetical protein
MLRVTMAIRRLIAPCLLLVAACDGGAGSDVPTPVAAGATGASACLPDEGIIVVGGSPTQTTVVAQTAGRWRGAIHFPGSKQALAYLSPSNQLAVLWTDQTYGIDHAHFTRTSDGPEFDTVEGNSFETSEFTDWRPDVTSRILDVEGVYLVDRDQWGAGVSQLDLNTQTWRSLDSTLLDATSVAIKPADPSFMFVGPGEGGALCEYTRSVSANAWFPLTCHPEIPVAGGGDSPFTGPQAVALPKGDVVIVYLPARSPATLGATVVPNGNHDRPWLAPEITASPAIGLSFAAAATPSGGVIVGVVSALGEVSMLRYQPKHGWSKPILIDTIAGPTQQIAAAPGICGDDAVIAYATPGPEGNLRVARVREHAVATMTVATFTGDAPLRLSVATRQTAPVPDP